MLDIKTFERPGGNTIFAIITPDQSPTSPQSTLVFTPGFGDDPLDPEQLAHHTALVRDTGIRSIVADVELKDPSKAYQKGIQEPGEVAGEAFLINEGLNVLGIEDPSIVGISKGGTVGTEMARLRLRTGLSTAADLVVTPVSSIGPDKWYWLSWRFGETVRESTDVSREAAERVPFWQGARKILTREVGRRRLRLHGLLDELARIPLPQRLGELKEAGIPTALIGAKLCKLSPAARMIPTYFPGLVWRNEFPESIPSPFLTAYTWVDGGHEVTKTKSSEVYPLIARVATSIVVRPQRAA